MTIRILTFHRACNYGAFLQAFALKSVLSLYGDDICFLDYWPESHSKAYRAFRKENADSMRMLLREIVLSVCRLFKFRTFHKAAEKYLGTGHNVEFKEREDLAAVNADCVIYGSDQIWWKDRLDGETGFDGAYWGDYVPESVRKVAYAPSMGRMDLTEKDKEYIGHHLPNFSSLSARETPLASLLSGMTGKEIPVVLDPTLLLSASLWEKQCGKRIRGRYVLLYSLGDNPGLAAEASRVAAEKNLKPVILKGGTGSYHNMGLRSIFSSPFDFVNLIRCAEFVVTDSFHGTSFSILFNKPFLVVPPEGNSSRITSLLDSLGIGKDTASIDYAAVNARLDILRRQSLNYLKKALEYGEDSIRH